MKQGRLYTSARGVQYRKGKETCPDCGLVQTVYTYGYLYHKPEPEGHRSYLCIPCYDKRYPKSITIVDATKEGKPYYDIFAASLDNGDTDTLSDAF